MDHTHSANQQDANADEACCQPAGGGASPARPTRTILLSQLRPGQTGVVRDSQLTETDAAFLGAMGLCKEARVRLCRAGEPCIVSVGSATSDCGCGSTCRIGLARPLAEKILVSVDA